MFHLSQTSGYLNLLANCIDNFTHGLAVAGSFLVSKKVRGCDNFNTKICFHQWAYPHDFTLCYIWRNMHVVCRLWNCLFHFSVKLPSRICVLKSYNSKVYICVITVNIEIKCWHSQNAAYFIHVLSFHAARPWNRSSNSKFHREENVF